MNEKEALLAKSFRYLNRFMVLMYRLGLGPVVNCLPPVFGQILILTHTGRKSGKRYRSGLNYAKIDGDLYCTAGFGSESDWYRNITAHPTVEVWADRDWHVCTVEEIPYTREYLPIMKRIIICSGFAAFAAGINPYKISDDELFKISAGYRLLRLRRVEARTGSGGPGDLAWVNAVLLMLLLPALLRKRK